MVNYLFKLSRRGMATTQLEKNLSCITSKSGEICGRRSCNFCNFINDVHRCIHLINTCCNICVILSVVTKSSIWIEKPTLDDLFKSVWAADQRLGTKIWFEGCGDTREQFIDTFKKITRYTVHGLRSFQQQ